MPLSAVSILNAFLLLTLLLGATASILPGDADVNPSMFTNATGTAFPIADDTERYICYLCTGRNPLLIRYCPICWDECHLVCYDDDASAASAAGIPATAPAPTTSLGSAAAENPSGVQDDECYVMKLYRNGSYAIVTRLGCAGIATCLLSCGGGDMANDSDRKALGTATASAVPATTTAAVRGSSTPRLAYFQRCGTQVSATTPSLRGAVVRDRDGGARRLR